MNSIMRRTVRGTATGLGALALIAGASACGAIGDLTGGAEGGDDPTAEQPAPEGEESEGGESEGSDTESEGSESEGAEVSESEGAEGADTESEDAEGSEGEDAAGGSDGEPVSEEELTAAGDQAFEFVKAAATGEAETACSLAMDPTTGSGMSGSSLESCVAGFEESAEEAGTEFDPSVADALDRSMVETSDNGDGTAAVSLGGMDAGFAMVQGEDGKWYVDSAGLI
ncbi:hypothetical protein HMPREF3159_08065 [Brachybacterium sp. HMSC06H03]|uniref:hypothetical protein n=1 Tax=Brachybacterium sp. HMSC06H03 TaxID=1581127 RepID=UPI0008A10BA7|nr:hypothetical protein [Brachybacterium sp. HMSC06H03]OFT58046.1 hypothetical protein HMPREF3159_08065 [Brachybacterium sp. HMSC06H03]